MIPRILIVVIILIGIAIIAKKFVEKNGLKGLDSAKAYDTIGTPVAINSTATPSSR